MEQSFGKYKVKQTLNSGSFGTVFLAEDENGKLFAIKRLQDDNKQLLETELTALKSIKGENIVEMVEFFYDQHTQLPLIVMEYCDQGDLRDYQCTKMHCIFNEDEALSIFAQILQGFKSIHEKGFIHRDLKERNILMKNNVAKISDFGLAKQLSFNQLTKSRCWTLPYAAPEILQGLSYNYKVDIWSLGVILFRMLFNSFPFGCYSSDVVQLQAINQCFVSDVFTISKTKRKFTQDISVECVGIFRKIFVTDCDKRIGFKELYDEPILQKYLKNEKDHKSFYKNDFDKIMVLQSRYTSSNHIGDQGNDEEVRQNMMMSVNKLQQFASKLAQNKQQQVDKKEEQFKIYLECLNQYFFLIESLNYFAEDIVFQHSICDELNVGLQFFITKNILYYIRGLRDILQSKDNIFQIKNVDWPQYVSSKTYNNLINNVKNDEKKWFALFKDQYEKITNLPNQKFFQNIAAYITEEVDKYENLETYHNKLPDSIKLPLRAVVMTCYKNIRTIIDDKIAKKQKFVKFEKDIYGRTLGRLIFIAAWNRIYNISHSQQGAPLLPKISIFKGQQSNSPKDKSAPSTPAFKDTNKNKNVPQQFEYLYIWLSEVQFEEIEPEINGIVNKYFPFVLENDFNFL
ncbi:Serine/Threonine kinase domain protein (macronuclear) [Tetrahymena thermophila SB210]|uniref:Serine/Threonine kinase domain protein n=1 Tax=Tetrahymena thermophila (strain SB210) TaxID=312017 RepID=Q23I97_TETTS|nr:Serine/Threonine kinase domain protein [Tetrahymena thermophila SB210]EAR96249.2 Serine/Threonine kinase domain protein [Tetrahymena thermophila SB210]|eukprot:XP_001016494.2 Serine/Threonine kinase domain protein [Tetrahymena thermophila SB210]